MLLLFSLPGYGQASLEVFGKNRIQYERFDWRFYEAEHFRIYHYDRAGRMLAKFVAEQAEKDLQAIQGNAGNLFPEKLSIILYNTYDDYLQRNIGLNSELQMRNSNPAGTVNIIGDKLPLYFTGNHADLKKQLRLGMAQMALEQMMFGSNFREMVRNAVLLDLPNWLTEGYAHYVVEGWTAADDNNWKNLVTQNKKQFFNDLAEDYPQLAGKAFWKYIAFKYGSKEIRNLLYTIQLKSNINKAAKLNYQQKIKTTFDSLMAFYGQRYASEAALFDPLDTSAAIITIPIPDAETEIRNIMVSPRGVDVAYVEWKHGEYRVILQRTVREKAGLKTRKSVILSGGVKNLEADISDPDYPLLAWSNTGFNLGILFKHKNSIRLRVYHSVKAEIKDYRIPASRFDRVTGFTFLGDDAFIALSAIKRGQSDLFTMQLRGSRLKQLTDDEWDDAAPIYVSGGSRKGLVFLSNRPEPYMNIRPLPNELPTGKMNAFFYSTTTESMSLLPLTDYEAASVRQITPYGSDHFAYLSDKSGVQNRYVILFARDVNNMDSAYAVPMTNLGRNIQYHQYNPASGKIADIVQYKEAYYVYFHERTLPAPDGHALPKKPAEIRFVDGGNRPAASASPVRDSTAGTPSAATPSGTDQSVNVSDEQQGNRVRLQSGDYFQSEFSRRNRPETGDTAHVDPDPDALAFGEMLNVKAPADSIPILSGSDNISPQDNLALLNIVVDSTYAATRAASTGDALPQQRVLYVDSSFIELRSHRYYLSFQPDFFSIRLDNNLIFNRYQAYDQFGGQYKNPSLAGMLMGQLFDKMEDYRLVGGVRLPANFSGLSYFVKFENFRRRTDWSLTFFREENKQSYSFSLGPGQLLQMPGKTVTNLLQGSVSYPLDPVKGLHFHLGLRHDKMVVKAQHPLGLVLPDVQDVWTMSRMEYVFDNTRNPTLNIWNGFRYKLFGEYMYKVYSDNDVYSVADTFRPVQTGGFYNLGFDLRYYHKIYKNFIAAIRVAGAHAGGTQQIMYYMGGVENAFNANFESGMQPSRKNNYAFQALATNLRGYGQNARNGNTYALINAELRLPVVSTFVRKPIQSSILKHLQAVAFVDVGSAWEGLLPTEDNLRRNYRLQWPAQSPNPTINVNLPDQGENYLGVGYGLGLRSLLFGYFIKVDAAMNINKQFHWYLSIGTDF